MQKTFKYRIYPTKKQTTKMNHVLEECRWLYNHFLEQRKTGWEDRKESFSLYDQIGILPMLKLERYSLKDTYSQVLQDVAMRVDLAFKAFFRRVKTGENPGYPRFKAQGRYNSFTFTQSGYAITGNGLKLSRIGTVKIKLHRKIEGKIKTCNIRKTPAGKWYAAFSCVVELKHLPKTDKSIGIDVGLESFATFSDGTKIDNPRFFREEEKELAKVQRKFSKAEKGTPKRAKRRKAVAKVHERISNRRNDFAHQQSRSIINQYDIIAIEDLSINKMVHNRCLSKSIHDAAWNQFAQYLSYKAEEAGRELIKVNPAYTSQTCSRCGHRQAKKLSDRLHQCSCCGLVMDRDHNAAINILALGLQGMGSIPRSPGIDSGE